MLWDPENMNDSTEKYLAAFERNLILIGKEQWPVFQGHPSII